MAFTDWSARLAAVGANPNELSILSASYYSAPANVQAALDALIAESSSSELTLMLTTWRQQGGPFLASLPGGGLPFGVAGVVTSNAGGAGQVPVADGAGGYAWGSGQSAGTVDGGASA